MPQLPRLILVVLGGLLPPPTRCRGEITAEFGTIGQRRVDFPFSRHVKQALGIVPLGKHHVALVCVVAQKGSFLP